MQNEACIRQGSEKEPLRQQLIDAKTRILFFYENDVQFDEAEASAISTIKSAADEQRMSPKAFLKAVEAVMALDAAKQAVIRCGYAVDELGEFGEAKNLFSLTAKYQTARAVVLGFEKSLTPNGWDILED